VKTIAITIENDMLELLDSLVSRGRQGKRGNRSAIVRAALGRFLEQRAREEREAAERKIWARHLARINRQAEALVSEQARP
jgi:Arc/MetJ-type ribon-helix-helix transcriptional regulator